MALFGLEMWFLVSFVSSHKVACFSQHSCNEKGSILFLKSIKCKKLVNGGSLFYQKVMSDSLLNR